jgi:predicted histidine transporter YuiF (NhaC family)
MLFVVVFMLIVVCEVFLGVKLGQNIAAFTEEVVSGVIIVLAVVFLAATAVVIAYYCVVDYLVEKQWVLEGYQQKKQIGRLRNMRIIPVDMD